MPGFLECHRVQFLHRHLMTIRNPMLPFLSFFLALNDTLYVKVIMAIYSINSFDVYGTRDEAAKSENFR